MNVIESFFILNDIPLWFFVFILVVSLIFLCLFRKIDLCFLIVYSLFILGETLLFRKPNINVSHHFDIFWSYKEIAVYWKEIVSNFLIFIPFGFVLSRFVGWKSVIISLLFSLIIELIQLIALLGVFEIDDIIHNVLGAFMGSFINILIIGRILKIKGKKDK